MATAFCCQQNQQQHHEKQEVRTCKRKNYPDVHVTTTITKWSKMCGYIIDLPGFELHTYSVLLTHTSLFPANFIVPRLLRNKIHSEVQNLFLACSTIG